MKATKSKKKKGRRVVPPATVLISAGFDYNGNSYTNLVQSNQISTNLNGQLFRYVLEGPVEVVVKEIKE